MRSRSVLQLIFAGAATVLLGTGAGATSVAQAPADGPSDPASRVDPFIGTAAAGHTHPAATLPFGMVQLGPDTRLGGPNSASGYHRDDDVIYGFSHTHLSGGPDLTEYGDILFMPMSGVPSLDNRRGEATGEGYASRLDRQSEIAEPGYYAVTLADTDVRAELTATPRVGMHRYRFPEGEPSHVVVDLTHRDRVLASSLRVISENEIEGTRRSAGWVNDQVIHFVARFSRPFTAVLAVDGEERIGAVEASGTRVQAVLTFDTAEDCDCPDAGAEALFGADRDEGEAPATAVSPAGELTVKVGLSSVDTDGARRNLQAELPGWDFDATRAAARATWNRALGAVRVTGGGEREHEIFYTALYHALLAPHLASDVDGRYRGLAGTVLQATGRRHYTGFLPRWNAATLYPMLMLVDPGRVDELASSLLALAEETGIVPGGELAGRAIDGGAGTPAAMVLAGAWLKGARGFSGRRALDALVDTADRTGQGLEAYRRQGFIGAGDAFASVSGTLEAAHDDACIARLAEDLGKKKTAARFASRSRGWMHVLDPETGLMRPRWNQRWLQPFDPERRDQYFGGAAAWDYSVFVPHELENLATRLGGDDKLIELLDTLFGLTDDVDAGAGLGVYNHAAQTARHAAWAYHHAGRPDRSNEQVRAVLDLAYGDGPGGLPAPDGLGGLSSWYVLAAIGLYPVTPCSDEYAVGAPLFDQVILSGPNRQPLVIRRQGEAAAEDVVLYPDEIRLDGIVPDRGLRLGASTGRRSFIRMGEIRAGGTVTVSVATAPSPVWGRDRDLRPGSRRAAAAAATAVLPAPYVLSESDRFRDELRVELASAEPGADIRYTFDLDERREDWNLYREPLVLENSATLRIVTETPTASSPEVDAFLHRLPNDWNVSLQCTPLPEHTAGGAQALVDGLQGAGDWRIGGWVGIQGEDFVATIDFGTVRTMRRVGARFLQDTGARIWLPTDVTFLTSADGEVFYDVAELPVAGRGRPGSAVSTRRPAVDLRGARARYLRVVARNHRVIDEGFPGAGDPARIFVDELIVE